MWKNKVDSLFSEWNKLNSPGCALGIMKNGKLIYSPGYGMSNLEKNIPISSTTLFDIGSISKQFTAACIVLLSQQGKLTIDDDIRKYIPELPDYGTTITIRNLLNHTSGLRDYPNLLILAGRQLDQVITPTDALDIIKRQKHLNFKPGTEWLYSNTGYFLASQIIERVSGKSFPSFVQDNIFGPLGMNSTVILGDHTATIPHHAVGYTPRNGGGFESKESNWELLGDGGIQTCVEDLQKWDNNFTDPEVGGIGMIEELLSPGKLNTGEALHYALGVEVGEYKGLKMISHEGIWSGYHAEYIRFPDDQFSVICLCNLSTMNPVILTREVADIFLASRMKQDGVTRTDALNTGHSVKLTDEELSQYVGDYHSAGFQLTRKIMQKGNRLIYVRAQGNESVLDPIGKNEFTMLDVPIYTTVTFTPSTLHSAQGMRVVSSDGTSTAFELFIPLIPEREHWKEYNGTYYSEELNINYIVTAQDSQLSLNIGGSGGNLLNPITTDIFRDNAIGTFSFSRNENNVVTGFFLKQSRNRNIEFMKK